MSFFEKYNAGLSNIFEKYKNCNKEDEENAVDLNDPAVEKLLEQGISNTRNLEKFDSLYEDIFETWDECFDRILEEKVEIECESS